MTLQNYKLALQGEETLINSQTIMVGNLYGAYHQGSVLNKDDVIARLISFFDEALPDLNKVTEIIKDTVGSFSIIYKSDDQSQIHLITSPRTTGAFVSVIAGKLYLFNRERDALKAAYKEYGYDADDYDVIDVLFSRWQSISPNRTISKAVRRIPGSMHAVISTDVNGLENLDKAISLSCYYYQHQSESEARLFFDNQPEAYETFVDRIEGTLKVYASTGKPLGLMFSGGIDSCCLGIAAKRLNIPVALIATNQSGVAGTYDTVGVDTIERKTAELIGLPYKVVRPNRFCEELREYRANKVLPATFQNATLWDSWIIPAIIHEYSNEEYLFISGEYMDTGYGIGHTKEGTIFDWQHFLEETRWFFKKPRFLKAFTSYLKRRLGYFRVRLTYSPVYLKGLSNESWLGKKLVNWHQNYLKSRKCYSPSYEYVFSPLISGFAEFFITLIRKDFLPATLQDYTEKYLRHKQAVFMDSFFSNDTCEGLMRNSLSHVQLNHLFRLSNLFLGFNNLARFYDCHDMLSGHTFNPLPMEGPLQGLWLNYMIGKEHVAVPKKFLYRYFKEYTGLDYISLRWETNRKAKKEELNNIELPDSLSRPIKAKPNSFQYLFSKVESADVLNRYYKEQPMLSKLVNESSPLKSKLDEILYGFEYGLTDLSYKEFMKFYNMEIYLRSIRDEIKSEI